MEEVKRYTIDFSDGETAEGVLYADYAALKKKAEELERTVGTLEVALQMEGEETQTLRAQLEAAKFRIAVLEEELNVAADKLVCDRCGKIGLHRCLPALQNICSTPQLTAQPDGVRAARWKAAAKVNRWNYLATFRAWKKTLLGKSTVLDGKGGLGPCPACLPHKRMAEGGLRAVKMMGEKVRELEQALSAAPAREDGVREAEQRVVQAAIEARKAGYYCLEGNCIEPRQELRDLNHALNLYEKALAAPAPVCVCGHSKADHAEKHGWECSEECACLKYTPAPAPDEVK